MAGAHRSGPLRVLGRGRSGREARPDRVRAMTAARIPSPHDPDARVLYLTREGCHLCEEALPVVQAEADRVGSTVEVRDIDEDPALQADWDYDVPVIIVDGKVHAKYRVDAPHLRAALARRPWWRRLTGRG